MTDQLPTKIYASPIEYAYRLARGIPVRWIEDDMIHEVVNMTGDELRELEADAIECGRITSSQAIVNKVH